MLGHIEPTARHRPVAGEQLLLLFSAPRKASGLIFFFRFPSTHLTAAGRGHPSIWNEWPRRRFPLPFAQRIDDDRHLLAFTVRRHRLFQRFARLGEEPSDRPLLTDRPSRRLTDVAWGTDDKTIGYGHRGFRGGAGTTTGWPAVVVADARGLVYDE